MKVDGSIHSLIQGVSQQPPKVRLMGQCQLQENCSSNPIRGLTRRPGTKHVANLTSIIGAPQFYDFSLHDIDYSMIIMDTSIKIFDTSGTQYTTIVSSAAQTYIHSATSLQCVTINDVTYIANTSQVCAMESATKTYSAPAAILSMIGGQYGVTYSCTVKWGASTQTFSYKTPDGATSTDIEKVTTTYIMTQLQAAFNAIGALTAVFSITRADDVLLINSTNSVSAVFSCTIDDGAGGTIMFVANNTVVDVGNLPRFAPQGYFVSVTGAATADTNPYYLQFNVNTNPSVGTGFGQAGVWNETVQQGIPYLVDVTTLPVLCTFNTSTSTFSIDTGDWPGRQVGDLKTNANPSFIGNPITTLSHFQGRLVILSGENEVMSRTSTVGTSHVRDFFRNSATVLADSDSIDQNSTTKNTKLEYAIPFNRDLILFAEKAQFITFGRTALTPTNSSLVLTTEFESDPQAKPVVSGRNIFYPIQYGSFTGIREFFNEAYIDTNNSRPTTQHVLQYLKGRATLLTSSTTFDLLLVHTDDNQTILYAHEYLWVDSIKKQASWSKWIFRNPVLHSVIHNQIVYLFCNNNGTMELETLDFNVQPEIFLTYPVMLDGKKTVSAIIDTIPNTFGVTTGLVVIQSSGCPNPGIPAEILSVSSSYIVLKKSMNSGTVIVGVKFMSRYQPTLPFVRDSSYRGEMIAVGTGKLTFREFRINYINTGYIGYTVTSAFAPPSSSFFDGKTIGDPNAIIGVPSILNGIYQIPFRETSTNAVLEINSDSHLPFTIQDIEWKGQYIKKGTRIPGAL